ncbi:gamma-glutamyltransferase [Paralimibaculum aggregatum]|uniref:Gamma-glutamyltransferase n=1 Tax=Paralimibaculum aggregatum TaxID=3036245 RepID=A0ABQ6LJ77_9RHOB|nr:gamma-glutamyltransferase family protein [Limibaculum sp. NKW23]GMG81253.1 gamma-glutamyltransferase [Limibaculum sp. NKW23]
MMHLTRLLAGLALAALPVLAGAQALPSRADPEAATGLAAKPLVRAGRQMIVTANPHATDAGLAMLRAGGSAADASIAALLVLNVVEPQSSGLGGGAFALVHGPDGLVSLDARETAPMAAGPDWFLEDGAPLPWIEASESGRAIGVPGLPRLLETLHARHGRLPWADLFAPAIRLAAEGFAVSHRLAGMIESGQARLARTEAGAVFLDGGAPLAEGSRLVQPALAETLRTVAREGAAAIYGGPIAEAIVAAAARAPRPGALGLADLAAYRVVERAPVCMSYRGRHRVCGMGPPSSGATTVGQILALMGRRKPADFDRESPYLWHLFAEASRLAYADRAAWLADPDQVPVPVAGLLDPGYIARRARLVHPFRAAEGEAEAGMPPGATLPAPGDGRTSPGTTHLSVIDAEGLAISLTASIETAFGSGRIAAGMLLNNQLTDFSFRPLTEDGRPVANAPGPGKRPRSSMAPSIVYRAGETAPHILIGSPGGSRIPEYVAGALIGMLDLGMDPAEAAALFHVSQRNRGAVTLEAGAMPPRLDAALGALGHRVETAEMTSGLHILRIGADGLEGGADPRREGLAAGD